VAHHFSTLEQEHDAETMGMWVFLATEVLFFGGLFTVYTVYRVIFPGAWDAGSRILDLNLGTLNTAVLLASSLTMAIALHAARLGHRRTMVFFLLVTASLGTLFLGVKGFEYYHKYAEHLLPGFGFQLPAGMPIQVGLFLKLYLVMTALHAFHLLVGICLVLALAFFGWRGRFTALKHTPVEMIGLYWHFVDIVWIFLFPLLYLIDRS
jgi:cytochrome c oxidase subunit 3